MRAALGTAGYRMLTPIQAAEIEPAMEGRDVMGAGHIEAGTLS
jgi:superfamily II DNA/RNA helicase